MHSILKQQRAARKLKHGRAWEADEYERTPPLHSAARFMLRFRRAVTGGGGAGAGTAVRPVKPDETGADGRTCSQTPLFRNKWGASGGTEAAAGRRPTVAELVAQVTARRRAEAQDTRGAGRGGALPGCAEKAAREFRRLQRRQRWQQRRQRPRPLPQPPQPRRCHFNFNFNFNCDCDTALHSVHWGTYCAVYEASAPCAQYALGADCAQYA
jgi:hypothetical protein